MIRFRSIANKLRSVFTPPPVVYGDEFFTEDWFANWDTLKHVLAELLLSVPQWRSVFDFGCGPGIMIDHMNECGIRYVGFDPSVEARELYLHRFGKFPDKYLNMLPAE